MSPGNGLTVAELAERIGGRVSGDGEILIDHVATLRDATKGAIAFVDHPKFLDDARRSEASCVIVPQGTRLDSTCTIEVASPKLAFALVAELLHPPVRREPHVDPTAVISRTADVALTAFIGANVTVGDRSQIGARTEILAGAAIGANVQIGVDCVIHPNAVLYDGVQLGDRVVLHAGVIVGADGFGYVPDESNMRHKFPQIGTVVIEDDVEIGANTCIDRGALGETRIGRATKIDNLVQVGHNVRIGARVVIAAQTGISGSVVIEDDVIVGGQVGFGEHVTVKKGAVIAAKSAIFPGKIIREGAVVWGIPARPLNEFKRLNAHFGKLPELREKIGALAARVEELAKRIAGQKGDD